MRKKVSELTPAEFQKAFPIVLEQHNEAYSRWYEEEKEKILQAVNSRHVARIHHIGSSAVKGLIAKPIVDILLEAEGSCHVEKLLEDLRSSGFGDEMCTRSENPFRLLLTMGMTCDGYADRVFLLHVRYLGDWSVLYFRDYLIDHPEVAAEYGALKEGILQGIENGGMPDGRSNGYSQAKLRFVQDVTARAREAYPNRYKP